MSDVINPFTDIPDVGLSPNEAWGSQIFDNLKSLAYGAGEKSFRLTDDGMWMGAETWAAAPFKVNMQGQVWASDITLTQYVPTGGAAADVNAGSTTVSGAKLTAGTVVADYVRANISISAPTVSGGTITGADIAIGSGNTIFRASSQGIWLGNANYNSAPFRVNMAGVAYANNIIVEGQVWCKTGSIWGGNTIDGATYIRNINANYITAGSINAAVIAVTNLNASNINTGTLNAGLINVINLNASNITSGSLSVSRLSGGSIDLGAGRGVAGSLNLYCTSNNYNGNITWYMNGGYYCHLQPDESRNWLRLDRGFQIAGDLDISGNIGTVRTNNLRVNGKTVNIQQDFSVYNTTTIWADGAVKISSGGFTKTAIVKTSKGYRSLYCMESPEVWFMDFCYGHKTGYFFNRKYNYHIDKLFREVTVPPYHFMPTMRPDVYQVWGRRRGHQSKRFEKKTREQYLKNERFLGMAK